MSAAPSHDFSKFVPGFEFLKNLSQGAAPAASAMTQWLAPTMDPEAIQKRIEELKAVQFWLDQNATALKATIQALEVQKMTLDTLKGMNFKSADFSAAFKPGASASPQPDSPSQPAPKAAPRKRTSAAKPQAPMPDPMQFWGSLTQQFQQIASKAMSDVAAQAAKAPQAATASPARKAATSSGPARQPAKKSTARSRTSAR